MGILSNVMKKNAVVLQKPSGIISIRVDLNTIQRKFYDALLYVAKQGLKKDINKNEFTISLSDLKEMLRKDEVDKNNSYYIAKLKDLKRKDVEYNILGKDQNDWDIEGLASLVSDLRIKKHKKTDQVIITFEFPSIIKRSLIDPNGIYANINLVVVAGLKSRYAIILYGLVKDYEKVQIPEMTIERFRKLFNIENKYKGRIDNLKNKVLDVAVNEINNNENVDFLVFYELRKEGKVYTHIKFHVKPKPKVLKLQRQANKILESTVKENEEIKELLLMIPGEYRRKEKVVSLILGSVKTKGKEYTKAQIEYTISKFNSGKVKDFVAYLKQSLEKDYASFEVVELGPDVVKPDDAVGYEGESIGKPGTKIRILSVDEKEDEEIYIVSVKNMNTDEVVWVEVERDRIMEYAKQNIKMKQENNIL